MFEFDGECRLKSLWLGGWVMLGLLMAACASDPNAPPPMLGTYQPKESAVPARQLVDFRTAQLTVQRLPAVPYGVGNIVSPQGIPGLKALMIESFLPNDTSGIARPAVVFLGTGTLGDDSTAQLAQAVAAHGFCCYRITWRLPGDQPPDPRWGAVGDVLAALRWLNANAEAQRISSDRIALVGLGAGAAVVQAAVSADPEAHAVDPSTEYEQFSFNPINSPNANAYIRLGVAMGQTAGASADGRLIDLAGGDAQPANVDLLVDTLVKELVEARSRLVEWTIIPDEHGTVRRTPGGGIYPSGTKVTLEAAVEPGYRFLEWHGDLRDGRQQLEVPADRSITFGPSFLPIDNPSMYTLKVKTTGAGTIRLDPPGGSYPKGTWVRLYKLPEPGYRHRLIPPAVTRHSTYLDLYVDRNMEIAVEFVKLDNPGSFRLTAESEGQGSVTLDPPGGQYTEGQTVTITATPASGWRLGSWAGDLRQSASPATVVVNADKTIRALFVPDAR